MVNILYLIICNVVFCNEHSIKKGKKTLCKEDFQRATKGIKDGFNKTKNEITNVYQKTKKKIQKKKSGKDCAKKEIKVMIKEPEQQTDINQNEKCNYKDFYDTVFKYENNTGFDEKIEPDNFDQRVISSYNDNQCGKPFINVPKLASLIDDNKSTIKDINNHTTGSQLEKKKILIEPNVEKSLQDIYKREFPNSYKCSDFTKSNTLSCKTKAVERYNDKKSTENANFNNFNDKTNSNLKNRKNNSNNMKEISSLSKFTPGKRASLLADKVIYKDIDYSIEPSYVVPIRDHKFAEIRKTFQTKTSYLKPSSSAPRSISFESKGYSTEERDIKRIDYVKESSSTFERLDVVTDVIVYENTEKEAENFSLSTLPNTDGGFVPVKILREKINNNKENLAISTLPSINILSTINEENCDINFKTDDDNSSISAYSTKSHGETLNQNNISQNILIFNSLDLNITSTLTGENFNKKDDIFPTTPLSEIIESKAFNERTNKESFDTRIPEFKWKEEEDFSNYKNSLTSVNKELILSNRLDPEITEYLINKSNIIELVNFFEDKLKKIIFENNARFISNKSIDFCSFQEVNDDESSDNNTFIDENKTGGSYKQVVFWIIVGLTVLCFSFSVFVLITYK